MMLDNKVVKSIVELSNFLGESEITVNDCRFRVLSEDEINVEFYDYQVELLDDLGLNSFSDFALSHILDNFVDTQYFKDLHFDIIYERQEYYDDSEIEELCRIYEEYDVEKMLEIDLQEQLNSVDSVEWCRDWMGDEEFCRVVEDNDLIDIEKLVEYVKEVDGYGILSHYDGNVYELVENGDTYYVIREE